MERPINKACNDWYSFPRTSLHYAAVGVFVCSWIKGAQHSSEIHRLKTIKKQVLDPLTMTIYRLQYGCTEAEVCIDHSRIMECGDESEPHPGGFFFFFCKEFNFWEEITPYFPPISRPSCAWLASKGVRDFYKLIIMRGSG